MDQSPQMSFVKQPCAHTGPPQRAHASEIGAALLQGLQDAARIVVPDGTHESRTRIPQRGTKRGIHDRATWLPHPRPAVSKHHIVNEQVAEQHDGRRHESRPSAAKARTIARTRSESNWLDQAPPSFTDDPTMKP